MTNMTVPQVGTFQSIILAVLALVPAIVLLIYIYVKDRVEKEPISLLVKLFVFGALIAIPVAIAEALLDDFVFRGLIFSGAWYQLGEVIYWEQIPYYIYHVLKYIFIVGLCEELGKFLVLRKITSKNKEFNSLFDGIVYAVFVSLGFAAFENVMYVIRGALSGGMNAGLSVALVRMVSAVPAHMFFAIIMGCNYSLAHIYDKAAALEDEYFRLGYITKSAYPFSGYSFMKKALIVPIIIHGVYDIFATLPGTLSIICWSALVIGMYIYCFGKVKQFSKSDTSDLSFAQRLVYAKYPKLTDVMQEQETGSSLGE